MGNCVGQRRLGRQTEAKGSTPKKPTKNDGLKDAANAPESDKQRNTDDADNVKKQGTETAITNNKEDSSINIKDKNGATQVGNDTVGTENVSINVVDSHDKGDIGNEKNLASSELKGEQIDKIDNHETIENIPTPKNNTVIEEGKTAKASMVKQKDTEDELKEKRTEDELKESVESKENSTQATRAVRDSNETSVEGKKDQNTKGQQETEVSNETKKKVEVAVDRPTAEGQVKDTEKIAETKKSSTGNSEHSDSNTGKPESKSVLQQVQDGRVVAMKQTKEISAKTKEISAKTMEISAKTMEISAKTKKSGKEHEEKTRQKRLETIDVKIKDYPRVKKFDKKIIDFEGSIFADEVIKRKVVLEDIFVSGREVSGVIAIACDEKHPNVTVRYSSDSWKSSLDEEAVPFNPNEYDNKIFRRFFFVLNALSAKSLEFAVRLTGDLGDFWDNNNSNNYRVESTKENDISARLIAKFTLHKQAMFDELVKGKPVMLKSASLKNGEAILTIATEEGGDDLGVRCTFDDWKTSKDVTEVANKDEEEGRNISEIRVGIPKQTKMIFSIFWRHEGIEHWDNNNGRNFEIQG